jgi:SnoaL-like domain
VLFEALTGKVPYTRESDVAKLYAHLNDPVPAASTSKQGVPPALDAVVSRAMAKDPDERFPSAGDLGRAATAALQGVPAPAGEQTVARGEAAPPGPAPATGPTVPLAPATIVDRQAGGPPPPPLTPPPGPIGRPPAPPSPAPRRRARWPLVALLALVLVALGAGGAIALSGGGDDDGGTTITDPAVQNRPPTDTGGSTPTPPPEDDVAADRDAISATLSRYEQAFTDQSPSDMGAVFTPDASREGFGSPDCLQNGRDQIVQAYQSQWDAGAGAYDLSYDPSDIEVSGDRASLERAQYSIAGGSPGRIDFDFERSGDEWLISRIDAIFQSCSP